MTAARRNSLIILLVLGLLVVSLLVIIPGSPLSKQTRLGLDLKGGVELVYEGRPTPKVPKVTPQAIDDALNTIRKRTDALGVSEPEIQRAGANQISIGLPAVQNADRAEQQVGTTAQLQFYDWEPNLIGRDGVIGSPNATPFSGLFPAVQTAAKAKPRAEKDDIPPGGPSKQIVQRFHGNQQQIYQYYDRLNDSTGDKYYLFAPGAGATRQIIRPGQVRTGGATDPALTQNQASDFYRSCQEIYDDFAGRLPDTGKPKPVTPPAGTACAPQLGALGSAGPRAGSTVVKVPQGIVVVLAQADQQPPKTSTAPRLYYALEDDSELTGDQITNPKQGFDPNTNAPNVSFQFTDSGKRAFQTVTKRIAQRGLLQGTKQNFAITLDNQIVSLAYIDPSRYPEGIDGSNGAEISGVGTIKNAQDLAESLRIGALPIELKLISKTQVSATLGAQALHDGLIAGAVGFALVLLFLLLFYRVLGVIAGLTLVTYGIFLFALVKLFGVTMTLPGIAGLILTLGVAADANIVIFERIKEEARGGASIPRAITAGYSKALRTIIDANVVTIGVAFILFMLATAGVRGFAFMLGIGTLVSLFTAVLATSAILGSMSRSRLLRSRWALNPGKAEHAWRFDYAGKSNYFFSMSGVILLICAIAISTAGINFGIDFESGTRVKTPLVQPASVDQVRSALGPIGLGNAEVQKVDDPALGKNVFQIQTTTLQPTEVRKLQNQLNKSFGVRSQDFSADSIGPTFGAQIARTALLAIVASLILISIYIGLRFEFKYAVPVLIALAHDLLITAGVYALAQREVTTSTVAALLTILGFSLYDTIIVFDRIRENVPRMPRATFSQIANRSMSEVIVRSLVTSVSTLFPVLALMLFGGATLTDFGFALLVGIASGAYSSIFIATPVLTHWKERDAIYRRRTQAALQASGGGPIPAYADGSIPDVDAESAAASARPHREPRARRAAQRASAERTAGPSRMTSTAAPRPVQPDVAPPEADDEVDTPASQRAGPERAAPEPAQPRPPAGDGAAAEPDADGDDTTTTGTRGGKGNRSRRKKHGRR
ncbi:MAG: SecD/SecF fusion protein [Thermoleophilales bacterium]|nr:SecD/SecF fusion protein [Thermoleophilales bacterium]